MGKGRAAATEQDFEELGPRQRLIGRATSRVPIDKGPIPLLADQRCQRFRSPKLRTADPIRHAENLAGSGQVITFHASWDVYCLVPLRVLFPGQSFRMSPINLWRYSSRADPRTFLPTMSNFSPHMSTNKDGAVCYGEKVETRI